MVVKLSSELFRMEYRIMDVTKQFSAETNTRWNIRFVGKIIKRLNRMQLNMFSTKSQGKPQFLLFFPNQKNPKEIFIHFKLLDVSR